MLENRTESMLHEKVKYNFNCAKTKIKLLYYHNPEERRSYYYPFIDDEEISLFEPEEHLEEGISCILKDDHDKSQIEFDIGLDKKQE